MAERHRTWNEIQKTVNDECFVIWLPTINAKLPVRNRFGNMEPSVIPHRLLWNIDRVFVKQGGTRAAAPAPVSTRVGNPGWWILAAEIGGLVALLWVALVRRRSSRLTQAKSASMRI